MKKPKTWDDHYQIGLAEDPEYAEVHANIMMSRPKRTQLTGWYRGDQKPVRVGWYQTKLRGDRYHDRRHWNGKIWSVMGYQDLPSATQNWMWRGRESA